MEEFCNRMPENIELQVGRAQLDFKALSTEQEAVDRATTKVMFVQCGEGAEYIAG